MTLARILFAPVAALALSATANAATLTVALPDIGTFTDYTTLDLGQTYTGNGFVGLYNSFEFAHLFGLEGAYSRTLAQANIGAVAGQTITSATFSFQLLESYDTSSTVTIAGYAGTGAIGYQFDAPAATFSTATSGVLVAGLNEIDVTSIVANAAAAGTEWLNLHFAASNSGNWTYTYPGFGYDFDRAQARLTINYSAQSAVPEPAAWTLMIGGFGLVGAAMRRRTPVAA